MIKKILPLLAVILFCTIGAFAQQNLFYNHYFINPALYNPSFIAPEGYSTLYLNYRKQWIGIKGAPTTGTLNFHLPLSYKAGVGITAIQDEAGLLTTSTGLISFSYSVFFGKRVTDLNKLSFGLAAGVTNSRIKADEGSDIIDPVLGKNTSSIDGQVGIHYQFNGLKIAFAIPKLFDSYTVSEKSFNTGGISQMNNTISSISYNFKLGSRFSFEPFFTYRTFQDLDPQFEALGAFKIDKLLWFGGSYRQDYGAAAFFGVSIKDKIRVGYAYEFATDQTDKIGNGSHEVQLILRVGKTHFARPQPVAKKPEAAVAEAVTLKEELKKEEEKPIEETPKEIETPVTTPSDQPVETVVAPVKPTPTVEPIRDGREQPTQPVTTLAGDGLAKGHYVVVGAFGSVVNAKNYAATLKKSGYPASVAFHLERGYYIVHMTNAPTLEEAKALRDKYRQMSRYSFKDTWILSIE